MPPAIIIVGLGPGSSQHWTQAAAAQLNQASKVYLRTARHPGAAEIRAPRYDFERIVEQANDPAQAYEQIAAEVIRLGRRDQGVVYAVPGHPALDEPTVPLIRSQAAAAGLPVTIVPGLSLLEAALVALRLNSGDRLQLAGAADVAGMYHPPLAPDRPALITQVYGPDMLSKLKPALLNAYSGEMPVTLVEEGEDRPEPLRSCALAEIDRQPELNRLWALYLPADEHKASLATFQETVAHLRAPEGCPWDRAQSHQSLRPFLLEETYEVLETLDEGDLAALAEELGDLLLQIALHAQIATEAGHFKMGDVIDHINRKLLRRHPHVFGDVAVNGVKDVLVNWQAIKKQEKAANNRGGEQENQAVSALDGLPKGLPALAQALVISKRAVQVGFEWPNIEGVLDKLIEEAREITEATDPAHLEAEIGDLLFSAVNLARWRSVDPESALRAMNSRFTRRFQKLEALAAEQGKTLPEMSIDEMDTLWNQAKLLVD